MIKRFRRYGAGILLVLFLIASTPDALIHTFTGHQDTRENLTPGTKIDSHHIHCAALDFTLDTFTPSNQIHIQSSQFEWFSFAPGYFSAVIVPVQQSSFGRAPHVIA